MTDYYQLFGLSMDAGPRAIKGAYQDLCQKYHPDLAGPASTEMMKRINEAYEVLSNPGKKALYDAQLRAHQAEQEDAESAEDDYVATDEEEGDEEEWELTETPPQMPPSSPPPARFNRMASVRRSQRSVRAVVIIGAAVAAIWILAATCSAVGTALSGLQQGAAVGNAQSTLNSDLYSLHSDVATLTQDSNFTTDLAAYARDWAQMQKDYHAEQSDYQQGCGASGDNAAQVRSDAVTVHDDLIALQDDDIAMGDDVRPFNPDLSQVQADMQTVQSDWSTLQEALAADAAGTPTVQSAADDVTTALSMAQQQVDASNKALQAAQAQTKHFDQEADQTNTAAQNLANSMHC